MGWSCDPLVVMTFRGVELGSKRAALVLTILMVTLPWTASIDSELSSIEEDRRATQTFWGGSGSNDTGWIDLVATGADPENGTYAYADLILDFAPGAEISNLTFEIPGNRRKYADRLGQEFSAALSRRQRPLWRAAQWKPTSSVQSTQPLWKCIGQCVR